jgi:hypothetical protein
MDQDTCATRVDGTHQIEHVPSNGEAARTWYLPDRFCRRALGIVLDYYQRDLHEEVLCRVFECILAELFIVVYRPACNAMSGRFRLTGVKRYVGKATYE